MDEHKNRVFIMTEDQEKRQIAIRVCPVCKGTGLDKTLHPRYTTGGHDDRSCPGCQGECYIEDESNTSQYSNTQSPHLPQRQ